MGTYICDVCEYEYNPAVGAPDQGVEPGTPFQELPENFECPECGVGKELFYAKQ